MKIMRQQIGALIGIFGGMVATSASATVLLYTDFSDTTGLQLNGDAAQVSDVLRVTPASSTQSGSVFSTTAISLDADASFSTAFLFQITSSGGIVDEDGNGADGIVFTVQTVSNTAGGAGGGIGYSGLSKSLGIEFDTWNNGGWDDNNGNHIGVDINGDIDSVAQVNLATGTGNSGRMNNGSIWSAWVDYNGASSTLEVRLAEGSNAARPSNANLAYTVDLPSILETTDAYVGFTSGTGAAWGNHDILTWQFNSTYDPIDDNKNTVPEPGTIALLGLGLAGAGAFRRRRSLSHDSLY